MELTAEEIKKVEELQPELKEIYRAAGYGRAIQLQKEIEAITGENIFYNEEIAIEAANCFHSGTWQVWHGAGVENMKQMAFYHDSLESLVKAYKENEKSIRTFVEVAEKYLGELKEEKEK